MAKVLGVIPQRMGSTRLPGKAMLPLNGESITYRFIERCKKSNLIDEFVMTVPDLPENDVLEGEAKKTGIGFMRYKGYQNDVLGRIVHAAKSYDASVVVRLITDNPCIEASEIDRIIYHYLDSNKPFCLHTNTHNVDDNGYPDGLGAEVYSMTSLKWLDENMVSLYHREHPHTKHFEMHLIETVKCPSEFACPELKLDVNTQEEYEYIKSIYERFGNDFHISEIVNEIVKESKEEVKASC